MSYGCSGPLQVAIYQHLTTDAALAALVGDAIHDTPPPGPVTGTYVVLGAEEARDLSDKTSGAADHRIMVSVVSDAEGFLTAKQVAGAVSDALVDASPSMSRGRVVSLRFLRARARRVRSGQVRRIDLIFRVLVDDD